MTITNKESIRKIMIIGGLLISLNIAARAQDKGIQFQQLSWDQVKTKAKAENKYIFVDCYASWCGPCKAMDNEVYSSNTVGETINQSFVSLKLQMDITKNDDDVVKKHYVDAMQINKTYQIAAFPTLLFFSPDGELVYRFEGAQDVSGFIVLAKNALNPDYQYTMFLRKYSSAKGNYEKLPELLIKTLKAGDMNLSKTIEEDYLHNYLDKLSLAQFATKEHIEFTGKYLTDMLASKDRVFKWFDKHGDKIDSVMKNDDCKKHTLVNFIIRKEEIIPKINAAKQSGSEPNWNQISKTIQKEHGKGYVDYNITSTRMKWYFEQKDYPKYVINLVAYMELTNAKRSNDWYGLNQAAWSLFQYSNPNQKEEMGKALSWIDRALELNPDDFRLIDTKANLLYKLGNKQQAILLETKAASISKGIQIQATLEKMQKNEQTWPDQAQTK